MIFEGTKKSIFFGLGLTRAGTNIPHADKLIKIATYFNISIEELVGLEKLNL